MFDCEQRTEGGTGRSSPVAGPLARIRNEEVGVGGQVAVSIPIYDNKGNLTGVVTKDNAPVTTALDESHIIALAQQANAEYYVLDPSSNGKLGVTWAAKLGGSKAESKEKPVYQYPLGLAIILLFGLFLRGLWVRNTNVNAAR